jgi:U3 small nucleolar RNA-associated protein 21
MLPNTIGDRPDVMALPVVGDPVLASAEAEESANEAAERLAKAVEEAEEGDEDAPYESAEQLDAKLVTLSSLPRSRWANLGRLDIIRRRNRPEAPPKAPALAPFFLSTVPGLSTTFKPMEDPLGEGDGDGPRSHIVNFGKLGALSAFQKKLCDCSEGKDCE